MFDKAVILPISPSDIDFYWDLIVEYIESALEHTDGEISLQDILSDIVNQERQLWIIKHDDRYIAAVITQIYSYNSGTKIGEITIAGGKDHHLWDHFVDVIGEWFKGKGCNFTDIIGRPGWERLYKDRGFKKAYVQLRRKIE